MESNDELFYGKEFADTNKSFKNELQTIETEHHVYFHSREAKSSAEMHERLADHYVFEFDSYGIRFNFKYFSDLPEQIKEQCNQSFKKHFAPKAK